MVKHLVHSFLGNIIFTVSLPDEFSPCSVSRPCKDLRCKQDWPKDIISKWIIMQTSAVLEILGLALACCLLDLPPLTPPPTVFAKSLLCWVLQSWGCPRRGYSECRARVTSPWECWPETVGKDGTWALLPSAPAGQGLGF